MFVLIQVQNFYFTLANSHATKLMLDSYNARLRSFLMANHYMDTPQFHTISGSEIIQKFGYRQCR